MAEVLPEVGGVAESVPPPARDLLEQAMDSLHSPAGAVMLAGSAVDAMLKTKGLTDGSLYSRIDQAADEHLITEGMREWAHQVRLESNKPRHVDLDAPLPSPELAELQIKFARALAEFLFVLPDMVKRGVEESASTAESGSQDRNEDSTT